MSGAYGAAGAAASAATPPARRPPLPGPDEVHVWRTSLRLSDAERDAGLALLSADERDRASRFRFEDHRRRFVAARAWLRRVLAGYLGRHPALLVFDALGHGKPILPEAAGAFDFNLSHSGDHAALAVSPGFPVGIDLEEERPVGRDLARHVFSPDELATFERLPEPERQAAFFRGWTRKEACLKALGSGLAVPPDAFSVSIGPGEPARLLSVSGAPGEAALWQVAVLPLGPGLAGAVAARRTGWRIVAMDGGEALPIGQR